MAQGDLTQKEVNSLLNMIGVEPHFESIPTPTTLFSTEGMRVSGDIFGIPYDFGLPAFEITGMVDVPQIVPEGEGAGGGTGLTKKASPYKGGINKSSYKGSGSGGSGGGGGGSGSGKTYEPKTKDPIEDELDRYERVNTMLEDAENRYDRLNADRERLTGFDMADDMEKEVELLNRQIALHREKLEIQKEEAQELRDELSSQYGITFDAEGFITNYAATHDRLVNEVNSLINQ